MGRRFLAIIILIGMLVSLAQPRRASASWVWDGHAWTVAIVSAIGAAAAGYFLAYESAMLRSKGSVKQGETIMNLPLFGVPVAPTVSPDPHELSLQGLRGIVMADVAYEINNPNNPTAQAKWRSDFETLRGCWNASLALPSSPAPSESPSSSPTPTSGPTTTPKPKPTGSSKPKSGKKASGSKSQTSSPPTESVVAYEPSAISDTAQSELIAAKPTHSPPPAKKKDSKAQRGATGANTQSSSSPSPNPAATPSEPTCSSLFTNVMNDYSGDVAEVNKLVTTTSAQPSVSPSQSPSPLSTSDAESLAFRLQTQVDSTDLAGYLANSPSLLSQVTGEQVGSYATDDYVRNLFLATAAIKFINELPTAPPIVPGPSNFNPNAISSYETLATDCAGVSGLTSGFKCLNDASSIEKALENAHIQREGCYWSQHVIMPTYSDIQLWTQHRGPYDPTTAKALGKTVPKGPPTISALIKVNLGDPITAATTQTAPQVQTVNPANVSISNLTDSTTLKDAQDAMNIDMAVLTKPPGC